MFLTTLLSSLYLLADPVASNQALEIIRQHHLETPAGRTSFLADKLTHFTETAEQINHEIEALAEQVEALSPLEEQPEILALTQEMTRKMDTLLTMLPVLNIALSVDEDFEQVGDILDQITPLTPQQQQVVDRIASLCSSMSQQS